MNELNSINTSLSEKSVVNFTHDLRHVKTLKIQGYILGFIALSLLYLCYQAEFLPRSEQSVILDIFLQEKNSDSHTLFVPFLIAAIGNMLACCFIINDARKEEKIVNGLIKAYKETNKLF